MIEVGEYVRNREGKIDKVKNPDYYMTEYIECEKLLISRASIVKHSKNIIDLLEVGDIVRTYDVLNYDVLYIWSEEMLKALKEDVENGIGIEAILTREQFAQAEYKIEEDK